MKFKIDENLPIDVASLLNSTGHEAETVISQNLSGSTDQSLIKVCQSEGRALITFDGDFADIRAYPPPDYPGLVVLRLKRQDKNFVLEIIQKLTETFSLEELTGKLWLVEENRIRIRG